MVWTSELWEFEFSRVFSDATQIRNVIWNSCWQSAGKFKCSQFWSLYHSLLDFLCFSGTFKFVIQSSWHWYRDQKKRLSPARSGGKSRFHPGFFLNKRRTHFYMNFKCSSFTFLRVKRAHPKVYEKIMICSACDGTAWWKSFVSLSLQFYGGSHPLLTFIYNKNSVSRSKHTPPTFKEKSPHQRIKKFQSEVLKRRITILRHF